MITNNVINHYLSYIFLINIKCYDLIIFKWAYCRRAYLKFKLLYLISI